MRKRNRKRLVILLLLVLFGAAAWLGRAVVARFSSTFETSRFRIELSETGEPWVIRCKVVDADGKPIEGTSVATNNNSGWTDSVTTDASGCAVIHPPELDVSGVKLYGEVIYTWDMAYELGYPVCHKGLGIKITVKE